MPMMRKILAPLYLTVALAVMASAIVSVAGPSTGYYPKTASFPPATCGVGQFISWGGVTWACQSIAGGGGVTSVVGSAPVAASCSGGACTVSAPSGGTWDMGTLKIGGVTAMGPSHTGKIDIGELQINGITAMKADGTGSINNQEYKLNGVSVMKLGTGVLYSGPSAVTLVDTVNVSTPPGGTVNVNLTAEGTIDWYRVNSAVQFGCGAARRAKGSGGRLLSCNALELIQGGSVVFQDTDATITFTAGSTDSTDGGTSGSASDLGLQAGPTTAPWGIRWTIFANANTNYVTRIYWAESQVAQATCLAVLPDGTNASYVWIGTNNVVTFHKATATYNSIVSGNVTISCLVNTRQGGGTPILDTSFATVGSI